MTERRGFKRLVRARMEKTGESYTAARASILAGPAVEDGGGGQIAMPAADASVRGRTGRGWEEWLDLLDEWGASERSHTEIARYLREEVGVPGWWAQNVTVGYERARGMRGVGENADGFVARASRTVGVPVERLYDAFMDEGSRAGWLSEDALSVRTANRPRGARFDWGGGDTRVIVGFDSKGEAKSTVHVSHERLHDATESARLKDLWRAALTDLKRSLEG